MYITWEGQETSWTFAHAANVHKRSAHSAYIYRERLHIVRMFMKGQLFLHTSIKDGPMCLWQLLQWQLVVVVWVWRVRYTYVPTCTYVPSGFPLLLSLHVPHQSLQPLKRFSTAPVALLGVMNEVDKLRNFPMLDVTHRRPLNVLRYCTCMSMTRDNGSSQVFYLYCLTLRAQIRKGIP